MNTKPVFAYVEYKHCFTLHKRGKEIATFDIVDVTETFMRWLVDLLNKNHAEFTKEKSEKLIRELGF